MHGNASIFLTFLEIVRMHSKNNLTTRVRVFVRACVRVSASITLQPGADRRLTRWPLGGQQR